MYGSGGVSRGGCAVGRGMRWLLLCFLNADSSLESFIMDHGPKSWSGMKLAFYSYKTKRPIVIVRLLHRKCGFQISYFLSSCIVDKEIKNNYKFFLFLAQILVPSPELCSCKHVLMLRRL